jgi:hypothetical protein
MEFGIPLHDLATLIFCLGGWKGGAGSIIGSFGLQFNLEFGCKRI